MLRVVVLLLASGAQAEQICTGSWDNKDPMALFFDDGDTVASYQNQGFRTRPAKLSIEGDLLVLALGESGELVFLSDRDGEYFATWRLHGRKAETKLACPTGFTLPDLSE